MRVKLAVVQHRLRGSSAQDAEELYQAVASAAQAGADIVVLPEIPTLHGEDNLDRATLLDRMDELPGRRLVPRIDPETRAFAAVVESPQGYEELGRIALFVGDACMDIDQIEQVASVSPDIAVMLPRSESDLQAEAMIEVALALSDSLAGVILIADTAGAEPGEPGHGGSAIIRLGELVAEAGSDDDVLVAEIETPVAQPEPREPFPQVPPILLQRLAAHQGKRLQVDYPADLTDGTGPPDTVGHSGLRARIHRGSRRSAWLEHTRERGARCIFPKSRWSARGKSVRRPPSFYFCTESPMS